MMQQVGASLAKAFVAYRDGNYASAVELVKPVRYKIQSIGGSNAQVGPTAVFFMTIVT